MQAALGHQEAASAVPAADAEMAILVLQNSLRSAYTVPYIGQQQKIRWGNYLEN